MSRPVDPVGRRYAVYSQVRHAVAVEAARLLYTREFKEYFQAKREAARRQATTVLPSNSEIHHQLLLLADRLEGPERQRRLERMRRAALEVMILLAEFEPRLIGSTWTGHIRRGSDIDINLFSDHPQAVTDRLRAAGIAFELERVQRRKNGQEQEFVHLHATHPESRLALEVTLYPASQLAHPPLCSITGGPMARASLSQLGQLLEQTEAPPGAVESERLSDPLASQLYPLRLEELSGDFPELLACRGVTQNDNHHLDVYQHTLAVVERLHGYLDSGFNDFEPWSGALRDHFARPLGAGWSRASLLILSGLCHNLGKPTSRTARPGGRVSFSGHEKAAQRLLPVLGERWRLPSFVLERVALLIAWHTRPVAFVSRPGPLSELHEMFAQVGDLLPELVLHAAADVASAHGPSQPDGRAQEQELFAREMLEEYFQDGFLRYPTTPVSATDLEQELGLDATRRERMLYRLACLYVDGEFQGREDGLNLAAELLASPLETW